MTERAPDPPRGRLGVFATICVFSFLVNFGRIAFAPLVDFFIRSGVSPATAGLAATAVWVGSALPRLPTGYLLTRVRRHHVLLGVGVWLAVASAITAAAPGVGVTIVGALLVGIASGGFFIAANPLASELYPRNVGIAVGVRGMASQVAAVAAPFLVAAAIALGSWRYTFLGLGVASMLGTAALAATVRRADLPGAGADDRDVLAAIRARWTLIAAGVGFVGLTGFFWQGVFNFYVTYLGTKGVGSGTATTLLTVTFAAGIPSWLVAGRLADRFSYLRLLVAILAGFAATLFAFTLVEGPVAVVAVSVAMSVVIHGLFPAADAYLLDTLPDEHRASAYAGYSQVIMLVQAGGSVTVGTLVDLGVTYDAVFQGYAVVVLVTAVGMGALARWGWLPSGG